MAPGAKSPAVSAHLSLAGWLKLEDLALDAEMWAKSRSYPQTMELNEFGRFLAQAFLVMILVAYRGIDAQRAYVPEFREGVPPPRHVVRCSGTRKGGSGKGKKGGAQLVFFDTFVPPRGVLPGVDLWLEDFMKKAQGKPALFMSFKTDRGNAGRFSKATRWDDVAMSKAHMKMVYDDLLGLAVPSADYALTEADITASKITLHGPRHILNEIGVQLKFPKERLNNLGRWAGSDAKKEVGKSKVTDAEMVMCYARDGPQHDAEVEIRTDIVDSLRKFLGGNDKWWLKVPAQKGEPVVFSFLSCTAPLADEAEEGVELVEEQ
jgi:hypothetical protein